MTNPAAAASSARPDTQILNYLQIVQIISISDPPRMKPEYPPVAAALLMPRGYPRHMWLAVLYEKDKSFEHRSAINFSRDEHKTF